MLNLLSKNNKKIDIPISNLNFFHAKTQIKHKWRKRGLSIRYLVSGIWYPVSGMGHGAWGSLPAEGRGACSKGQGAWGMGLYPTFQVISNHLSS